LRFKTLLATRGRIHSPIPSTKEKWGQSKVPE
jgi:hypothetical protein